MKTSKQISIVNTGFKAKRKGYLKPVNLNGTINRKRTGIK